MAGTELNHAQEPPAATVSVPVCVDEGSAVTVGDATVTVSQQAASMEAAASTIAEDPQVPLATAPSDAPVVTTTAQRVEVGGFSFSPPEDLPEAVDSTGQNGSPVWFMRLSEFVQRRVNQAGAMMTPILESRQQRTPAIHTPSPPRSQRLFSPEAEHAMQQWARRAPLLYPAEQTRAPQTESSSGSLTQEQMMAEVQRQVRSEMRNYEEERVMLQSENTQLKSMLERVLTEVQTRGLDERRGHDDRGNSAVPVGGAVPGDTGVCEGNPAELRRHSEALGEDPLAKQPGPAPQPRSSERLSAPPGCWRWRRTGGRIVGRTCPG